MTKMETDFKIGDIIEGEVTGIQNYGIFVSLSESEQGLVHISEIRHGFMTELNDVIKIGDKVKVTIIDIDEYSHKISLSMRALIKLNTPPFPATPKRRRKRYLPNIGFTTLAQKMPEWTNEALINIDEDQFEIKTKIK